MSPRLGGALLVLLAAGAASEPTLRYAVVPAALLWLACVRRSREASMLLVVLVAVGMRLPFLFGEAHSNDLFRYLWEGRVQQAGFNPYAHAPNDPVLAHLRDAGHARINHPELTAIYPPLAQFFFRAAAALGLTGPGLRNLVLLLDMLVVLVLLGWLRAAGRPPGWALVYASCPVAVCAAAVGHYDPLMLLALAGAGWAWQRGRAAAAGALLGAAILAKTVAVLILPWMLLRRPRAALIAAAAVVLGYLPFADGDPFATLQSFGTEFAFNASLFRTVEWLVTDAAHARLVVAVLLLAWTAWVTLTQPRLESAAALLLAGLLLLSPTVHYWYLGWFLVLLGAGGPRVWTWPLLLWAVTVLFSFETYRAHYAGAPFEERFALTWAEYLPPAGLALWLGWRHRPRRLPLTPASAAESVAPFRFGVVVPCRGEAANLRELLPRWLETDATAVVVADTPVAEGDAGDGTRELVLADETGRLVYLPVHERGYGAAVRAGLAELRARGVEAAVICDADHARGPEQVAALLAPLANGEAVGLVAAARPGSALTLPQRLGNALVAFLIGLGWGRWFHDLGPFRALRLASWPAEALRDRGFGWNVEMNVRALDLGLDVVEVALPASERLHGENRISGTAGGVIRAGVGILRQLYRLREESCESCLRPSSS